MQFGSRKEDPAGKSTGSLPLRVDAIRASGTKSVIPRCQEKPLRSPWNIRTLNRHR